MTKLVPTSTGAESLVENSRTYRFAIDGEAARDGCLHVNCDWPRFEDGIPCKHVWATVLAMDPHRESWRVGGTNELSVHGVDDFDGEPMLEDEVEGRRIFLGHPLRTSSLVVDLFKRDIRKTGASDVVKRLAVSQADLENLPGDPDTELLRFLLTVGENASYYGWGCSSQSAHAQSIRFAADVSELVVHDGKVLVRDRGGEGERPARLRELGLKERGDEWTLPMKISPASCPRFSRTDSSVARRARPKALSFIARV